MGRWKIGIAYLATDVRGGPPVIVVSLRVRPAHEGNFLDWARTEAERTRELVGSGLVTIQSSGRLDEGGCYVMLDRFGGVPLLQEVRSGGPLDSGQSARAGERVARLVAIAHRAGVVLGDLRPSTLLFDHIRGADPVLTILDLGLGRGLETFLEEPPKPARAYHSPQRIAGEAPTRSDDIYALGGLIHYMSTGKSPSVARPGRSTRVATPPSWVRPDLKVSPYLDPPVLRAMSNLPEDRWPSADMLAEALAGLSELFRLSPAAREVLGMPEGRGDGNQVFRREPTSPHLLHDYLGVTEEGTPIGTPPPLPFEVDEEEAGGSVELVDDADLEAADWRDRGDDE